MERTERYADIVKGYRKSLRDIWEEFEVYSKRLEKYRGSEGYSKEIEKLEKARDEKISALQTSTRTDFHDLISTMRESATSRKMAVPTADDLAIIQALKMRKSISKDELTQASRTLKDSPVCLSILTEIASDMGYPSMSFGYESTDSILEHIDSLETNADNLCRLNKCDSRKEMIWNASHHHEEYTPDALRCFTVDRDFVSTEDVMSYMGGVEDFKDFKDAVNASNMYYRP